MSYVYKKNETYSIDEILNRKFRDWDAFCLGCEKMCAYRLKPIVKRGNITGFVPYVDGVKVECSSLGSDIAKACERLFSWCCLTCLHSKRR